MKIINVPEKELNDFTLEDFGGKRSEKTACVVRYGAIGDVIISASLFPVLKESGYRVCVNVTEQGKELYRSDPNIDELLVQKTDQIPATRLTEYWEKVSPCFDKFVQLCESIEGTLLLMPERMERVLGKAIRVPASKGYSGTKEEVHKQCNTNYLEYTHDLAGMPYKFNPRFYPTKKEKRKASDYRRRIKAKSVVMWVLAGSSVHKVYPWTDVVMADILSSKEDVVFITVGDNACQLLEIGWEKEKRVITKSGKWTVRETLSFVEQCDVVIGPETGVINASAMLDNHTIVLLSHSSKENMSKHWVNSTTFEPEGCPCFPCHKMHSRGFETCTRDAETGGALCAANITPNRVVEDILRHIK